MAKRQALKNVNNASWLFGHPVLRADGNSTAYWARPTVSPYNQKGGGWMPCLHAGVQDGNDWAAVYIPVNEMPVTAFTDAQWAYYMTSTQTMGANMVIWVHDADDFDKRAEITQAGNIATLEKTAGWNAHEFDQTVTQMFFYGEGTTGTDLTAGTRYTWDQFQADPLFKDWVIYRITFEMGWEASGTFDQVWIAEIKLNGIPIPLKPGEADKQPVQIYATGAAAIAHTVSPKTPFKLLSHLTHLNTAATQQTLTVTIDAGRLANVYDQLLVSEAMAGITDLARTWDGGLDCKEDDEIDTAWTNTDTRTYGLTVSIQTVF